MESRIVCFLLVFSCFTFSAKSQLLRYLEDTPEIIRDPEIVTKQWEDLERIFKKLINDGIKLLMPVLMDDMQGTNISSTCIKQTMQVIGGIKKLKPWAMRFPDSSAKSLDGLITLTMFNYGAYDECLDTVAIDQRSGKHKGDVMFTGKYCLVGIKPPLPPKKPSFKLNKVMNELKGIYDKGTILSKIAKYAPFMYYLPVRIALCIPSGCTVDDINQVLSKVADYTHLYIKVKRCEVKEDVKFTPIMIFVISLYSCAGFMVLLGTLIDLYCYYAKMKLNSKGARVLLAFSFISNFQKFVDTSTSSKQLSCLNGIRFLTMSWIILAHTYLLVLHLLLSSYEYVLYMVQEFTIQVIMNGFLAVDTFFFIGGLLVCYVSTNYVVVDKGSFNVKVYILHRLWRIVPVYIFAILFVFLMEIVSNGPTAHQTLRPLIKGCENNWWSSLLFINNFYKPNDICFPQGWYLTVDMQLYMGALIILLPLFRWPKVGISIAVCLMIGFMVILGAVTHVLNLAPTVIVTDPSLDKMLQMGTEVYIMPYTHGSSYIIGMLTGYLLAVKPTLKIPKMVQLAGWSTSIILSLSVIYGTHKWNKGIEPTTVETVLYASCHRVAWTLSVAWMVVCCATGHGGVVNYILSWKMWIPLGRLTFIAYLAHPLVQLSFVAIVRATHVPIHMYGVWLFFGHLMGTYGVAFAGSMLIESPLLSLEKILLPRHREVKTDKSEKDINHSLNVIPTVNGKPKDPIENFQECESYKGIENSGFVCRL